MTTYHHSNILFPKFHPFHFFSEEELKILITEGLSKEGLDLLKSVPEFEVVEKKGLPKDEIKQIIRDYDALIVRSGTKVTADIIEAAAGC